ncbi:MAG: nuclear transport factor 2 family protein [Anaerolineae bacterium]|nr:nuclear transport factor 2 family protein [Anaerolineae bacterium]
MSTQPMINKLSEEAAVEAAVAKFHIALNAMFTGDITPMEGVWSHTDDIIYRGPAGGCQVGWQQVRADWAKQAALKLGGSVKPVQTRITVDENIAIVRNYVAGQNFDADGNPRKVSIRAISLFRKQGEQWKMIGLHTDLLPFLI